MAKAASRSPSKGDVFDLEHIRELVSLMEQRGLSEIELKQSDQQIRLVRSVGGPASPPPVVAAPTTVPASLASPVVSDALATDGPHIKLIKAPMVGTFYSRPNPKSDDFVKVGSKVSPDTVVCIVEAMKVFNEIPAEISGTIVEVLVANEEAVDFDRPLFKLDTRN